MIRLLRYLWVVSMLIFLAIHLYYYTQFPNNVILGKLFPIDFPLSKSNFFYAALGTMMLFNVLFIGLKWAISKLSTGIFISPKKSVWFSSLKYKKNFYTIKKGSVNGLAFIINLFFIYCILLIYSYNSESPTNPVWGVYLSVFLLVAWIIYFFVLLTKPVEEEIEG